MLRSIHTESARVLPSGEGFSNPRIENSVRNFNSRLSLPGELTSREYNPQASTLGSPPFSLKLMTSSELEAADLKQSFLVSRILTEGQHCIIGGPKKCLKTGIAVDLSVSLASGTPFLSNPAFDVPRKSRVCLISGESGLHTLREMARRIRKARGLSVTDADVLWGSDLPQLANAEHLRILENSIRDEGIDVLMIDPAYLCLLGGSNGANPANVFAMGAILKEISDVGSRTGATLILVHHTKKREFKYRFTPTDLDDLAMSGFAEWARQWLLLGRRRQYGSDGKHELSLNVGGSAGHSGAYAVDIDEGVCSEPGVGRHWSASVEDASEAKARRRQDKYDSSKSREEKQRETLLTVLERYPKGETKNVLKMSMKPQPTSSDVGGLLQNLISDGLVECCKVTKNRRPEDGYRLVKTDSEPRSVAVD